MISSIKSYHILYSVSLAVLCFFYYQDTIDLPLDTHDDETLIDNRLIRADPLLFFSSAKKQFTGRPIAEAAKFIVGFPLRDDTRPFHIIGAASPAEIEECVQAAEQGPLPEDLYREVEALSAD